jgi:hypothetical protein
MNLLLKYLQKYGILLCNTNPDLPALEDIGCGWSDVTELIDRRELFYCKAFRKRTTYLSKETYYLLKEVRQKKPLTPPAQRIYAILENGAEVETGFIKAVSGLDRKAYREGFDFLLQNLYVTALRNGKPLNESWSTFLYAAAAEWEKRAPGPPPVENAAARLWEILSQTMTERQFRSLTGRSSQPPKPPFQQTNLTQLPPREFAPQNRQGPRSSR